MLDVEVDDLKRWVESLEDEFEPMLGVPDDAEVEEKTLRVLDQKLSSQQAKSLHLQITENLHGMPFSGNANTR